MSQTIPQRELRNQAGSVLRRAERGERFTITVDGRPVAELGPLPGARAPAPPESFARVISEAPVGASFAADVRRMREEDEAASVDPWA